VKGEVTGIDVFGVRVGLRGLSSSRSAVYLDLVEELNQTWWRIEYVCVLGWRGAAVSVVRLEFGAAVALEPILHPGVGTTLCMVVRFGLDPSFPVTQSVKLEATTVRGFLLDEVFGSWM